MRDCGTVCLMNTLYLTPSEEKMFSSRSADLQQSWTVTPEVLTYADTPERRAFRFQMLRVQDPQLIQFREKALQAMSDTTFIELASSIDLTRIDNRDLTQIVFALGPDAMGMIITGILQSATMKDDIELAAAFSALRHGMLESFADVSLARS